MRKLGVYSERAVRAAGEMRGPEGLWAGEGEARGWPTRPRVGVAWPRPSVLPVLPPPPPGAPSSRPWCLAWPVTASRCHCQPAAPPAQAELGQGVGRLRVWTCRTRVFREAQSCPGLFWKRGPPRGSGGEGVRVQMPPGRGLGLRGFGVARRCRRRACAVRVGRTAV